MLSNKLSRTLACIGLAVAALPSHADILSVIEPRQISELWLNPGLYSHHQRNDKERNDNNYGIGGEYRFSTVSSFTAGVFKNSFRETSHYIGLYWQPIGMGPFRLGAAVGAINGYSRDVNGGWFLAAIPTVSIEGNRIGASLMYLPRHTGEDGAIALMLRLRAF